MVATRPATQQTLHKVKGLYDLKCPARDGVELSTDVLMPEDGGPFPTLLMRIP